jgi:mannosyltransferase
VTGVASPPAETAPAERSRRWRDPLYAGNLWKISLGVLVVVGVAFRFYSQSALWLDEAQSVAIAKLPLHGTGPTLIDGLRQDGSPPLYYLILHGWISLFGSSAEAVRALSAVIGLIAVPPLYILAKRVVGVRAARVAVVFYLASPFAIRFASETRMYSLVLLLSVLFGLAFERTLRQPNWQSVVGMALTTGLLALTHYWTLYLLLTVGIWVVVRSFRGPQEHRRPARLAVLGLLCGFLVFLPWLSNFRYQSRHTGTPWGDPASLAAVVHAYGEWAGGSSVSGRLSLIIVAALIALAIFGTPLGPRQILLDLGGHQPGKMLFFLTTGTLVVAVAAGQIFNTAYADRYTAVAFVPFLLLTAVGTRTLSSPLMFRGMVALVVVLGLINGSQYVFNDRTQARQVADVLRARAGAGDIVLYCPDQLGPAVTRLAPKNLVHLAVPTLGPADRVNWVDYAQRNEKADGKAIADRALAMAGDKHNIWLVVSENYKTYDTLCPAVQFELQSKRPHAVAQVTPRDKVYEHEALIWFLRH